MGHSPGVFWSLSWLEFTAMADGFAEWHSGGAGVKPPSKDEAADIVKRGEELLRKQGLL
jgi:hypothetical protein